MGCDGGTIPKRHELVKTKKKAEAKDKDSTRATLWTLCALTSQLLKAPIVACELGKLYNKEALIEYLLDKSTKNEKVAHIKGLKNVTTLKLSMNPAWESKEKKGDGYHDTNVSQYICPITGLEMNGKYKFCFLMKCACVLSQKALKEIKGENCPVCSTPYDKNNDVIIINPTEEEAKAQREKMVARKESRKESRKNKKEKKSCDDAAPSTSAPSAASEKLAAIKLKRKAEEKKEKETRFSKETYSSDTFRSLFTTHHSAKRSKDQISCWETPKIKTTQKCK